ncbi:uncharacterized protein VTP21DRAFT_8246 [Calcarisporiella thermophila]|uniref:uncharacterized protein n=1 Tax=Calcarisporiella thermophila TaxID=911321 RepID=UPI003742D2D8
MDSRRWGARAPTSIQSRDQASEMLGLAGRFSAGLERATKESDRDKGRERTTGQIMPTLYSSSAQDAFSLCLERLNIMAGFKRDSAARKSHRSWYIYFVASLTAVGGFLFGYDAGIISGVMVMDSFKNRFGITNENFNDTSGSIAAILQLGGFAGSFVQHALADYFGRKWTIIGMSVVFCIGAVMQTVASSLPLLYAGRCIGGFGLAIVALAVSMYNAEASPSDIRGAIVGIQDFMLAFGAAASYWTNYACERGFSSQADIQWRLPLGIQLVFSVILIFGVMILPKSPRWLAMKNRREEAARSLAKLRGLPVEHEEIQEELREIYYIIESRPSTSWKTVFAGENLRRLSVGLPLIVFQQFTGQNAIAYFAPTMFNRLGVHGTTSALLATGVVGLVKWWTSLVGVFLVDRVGRRLLLMAGTAVMCICMFFIGGYSVLSSGTGSELSAGGYIAAICVYLFMFGYSSSWGVLHFVIPAEIYTQNIRAKAETLSGMVEWPLQAASIKLSPIMLAIPHGGAYFIFGGLLFLFFLWAFFMLPETKGHSLENMNDAFVGNPFTRWRRAKPRENPAEKVLELGQEEKGRDRHMNMTEIAGEPKVENED